MNHSKLLVAISVYKKTEAHLRRLLSTIPEWVDVEITTDGGWTPDYDFNNLKKVHDFNLVKFTENKGLGYVRNDQLKRCNHEYIQFMDADDWLNIDVFEKFKFNSDIIVSPFAITYKDQIAIESRNIYVAGNTGQTYFAPPTMIFRTDYLKQHQLQFDESRHVFEDVIFSIKLTELNPTVEINSEVFYYGNDIPDDDRETLSHPKDNQKIIDSTFYVVEEILKYAETTSRPDMCYIRMTEELLRLLRLDLQKDDYNKVINYLKPYRFNAFRR